MDLQSIQMPGRRGLISYKDKKNNKDYVFIPIGGKIYKIDAKTGKLEKKFGKKVVKSFTLVAPLIYKNKPVAVSTNSISIFNINNGTKLFRGSLDHREKNFQRGSIWGGVALDKKWNCLCKYRKSTTRFVRST